MTPKHIESFLSKVLKGEPDQCWPFQGYVNKQGDGYATWPNPASTSKGTMRLAHHVAYIIANGSIPEGKRILHTCPHNSCCNPAHLFASTGVAAGRGKFRPNKGEIPIEKRFWKRVDKRGEDECWPWIGQINTCKSSNGNEYKSGRVCFRGTMDVASRVAWILANGEIPNGIMVCHTCDNGLCMNPKHLFLGTAKDNTQDCHAKGRFPVRKGTAVNTCKLKPEQVLEIRAKYSSLPRFGALTILANEYGVKPTTIMNIVKRRIWKHLT